MRPSLDQCGGCLIGGAAGDALGYAVEFCSETMILDRYGASGITRYQLQDGAARISDDTQMTLFTANGLLYGATQSALRGEPCHYWKFVSAAYRDWYETQTDRYPLPHRHWAQSHCCWLLNVPELFHQRAPGNTCMSALAGMIPGTVQDPVNQSKGCGGVMRVAPVGLHMEDGKAAAMVAADCAAVTHGHEMGYIPAAMLAHIIHSLSHCDGISLNGAVASAQRAMVELYQETEHLPEFMDLIDTAVELAQQSLDDRMAIRRLGAGWCGDEAIAIAIYCALRHSNSFERALTASVNHGGDSDSTGAITGNIMGAYLGLSGIPEKYLEKLELRDVIMELAADLHEGCPIDADSDLSDPRNYAWYQKYVEIRHGLQQ